MKQEILDKLNEYIVEEKGTAVTMKDTWDDAGLDSLGTMIVVVSMESEYPIFDKLADPDAWVAYLDFPNLTIKRFVKLCVLSTIATSEGLSSTTAS